MYYTYAVLLALGFDGDYISDPSDRGLVSLKVTLAMCSSLASTVSDSEHDDDAFVGPIASWFVLIDDRLQNQTDSKH